MGFNQISCAHTILDVVDGFFPVDPVGSVDRLGIPDIERLGEEVHRFYENVHLEPDEHRVYLGGWHGGWPAFAAPIKPETLSALLYYESILIHDPLAEYFRHSAPMLPELRSMRNRGPHRFSVSSTHASWAMQNTIFEDWGNEERIKQSLKGILACIEELRPAIRSGIVVPHSVWPSLESRRFQLEASVRADVGSQRMRGVVSDLLERKLPPLVWDNLRGVNVLPSNLHPDDQKLVGQNFYLYLAKSMSIADDGDARYVPFSLPDFRLFAAKIDDSFHRLRSDSPGAEILSSVSDVLVPGRGLPIRELVSIRNGEEAFKNWQAELRTLVRDVQGFEGVELSAAIRDRLAPRVYEVKKALEDSAVARRAKKGFSQFAYVSASTTGGMLLGAAGSPEIVGPAVMTGAGTGALAWALNMFAKPGPEPGREILWALLGAS